MPLFFHLLGHFLAQSIAAVQRRMDQVFPHSGEAIQLSHYHSQLHIGQFQLQFVAARLHPSRCQGF